MDDTVLDGRSCEDGTARPIASRAPLLCLTVAVHAPPAPTDLSEHPSRPVPLDDFRLAVPGTVIARSVPEATAYRRRQLSLPDERLPS